MRILRTWPEVAVLVQDGRAVERTGPPDGHLFITHRQAVPEDATMEDIFGYLESCLLTCEEWRGQNR